MVRIAILDDYQNRALASADWDRLSRAQTTVFDHPLGDEDVIAKTLEPFQVVVLMRERTPFPATLINRLANLRLLVTTGRRNKSIDLAAAGARGVVVCGTDLPVHPPAELTWALILALVRDLPRENADMHTGGWQTTCGIGLKGRVLGIVGLGRQGRQVARIGAAFGMDVVAWSRNLTSETAAAHGARPVGKSTLLATADVVTLHVPLTAETRGLIGAGEIAQMKRLAYLVNTSRGPLVDETALIAALNEGHLAGAGLDVYDIEPLPADHLLRRMDRVILTGHTGNLVEEMYALAYDQAVENIESWLAGNPLRVLGEAI
jgi:phosphoglycerate dehydrogenase-like enzyme